MARVWMVAVAVLAAQQPRDDAIVPAGRADIAGMVVADDATAAPLRAAIVTLSGDGAATGQTTITDDRGRFVFAGLPAGRVTVSARKPGYLSIAFGTKRAGGPGRPVLLRAGERVSDLVIRLPRAAVIAGSITDATGAPARDVGVMAVRGSSSLPPPGPGPSPFAVRFVTDDRGAYRIFDLPSGEYAVVALPPATSGMSGAAERSIADVDAILGRLQQRAALPGSARLPSSRPAGNSPMPSARMVGFVPIFYPGTAMGSEALRVRVGPGEERTGVDFVMPLVGAATVEGIVSNSAGPPDAVSLSIAADEPIVVGMPFFPRGTMPTLTMKPDAEGRFRYSDVPPGRYTITARTTTNGGRTTLLSAMADVTVTGEDVTGVALTLQPALTVSGRVVVSPAAGTARPDLTSARVTLRRERLTFSAIIRDAAMGAIYVPPAEVRDDGTFVFPGVVPGRYEIMVAAVYSPAWWLQSAAIGGRDVADAIFDLPPGGAITDAVLTLSDRRSAVLGRLQTSPASSPPDYVVILFPADRALWRAGSRRIKFARPSMDGEFAIRDLPPGAYLLGALTDIGDDDASDPSLLDQLVPASMRLDLAEGEVRRVDVRAR